MNRALSRARGAWLKGRLHAEVRRLEFSILSLLYLGCRPGIALCERVKGWWRFLQVFLEGYWIQDSDLLSCPSTDNKDYSVYYHERKEG